MIKYIVLYLLVCVLAIFVYFLSYLFPNIDSGFFMSISGGIVGGIIVALIIHFLKENNLW